MKKLKYRKHKNSSKKITKYNLPNPTNVKDPRTDGYTVVVHPCQEIQMFLTKPTSIFKDAGADDEWDVKALSNYFYLDAISDQPGHRQFNFIQFYDMTPWVEHSSVYLGEIEVTLISKTVKECFTLCVMARSVGKQSRIVTAINPTVNRIKIDLDEILEVVVCKDNANQSNEQVWCSLYDMGRSGTGNGSQWFEKLRQETVILPKSSPMPHEQNNLYLTISRAVSSLEKNPGLPEDRKLPIVPVADVQIQHHFWFRVRPEDQASVLRANSSLPIANVVFNNRSGSCSNLQLLVSKRGVQSPATVPEYDKDRYEGHFRGLVGRHFYPSSGLLINPSKVEGSIELVPDQSGVLVEFAPPRMTWPYTDPKIKWKFQVEPVLAVDAGAKTHYNRLSCTELSSRSINQQTIQRFFIKPECKMLDSETMLYLGVVNFLCEDQVITGIRAVNCWLVRERTVKDEQDVGAERYKSIALPNSRKQHGTTALTTTTQVEKHENAAKTTTYTVVKYVRVVKITENRDDNIRIPNSNVTTFQSIKIDKKDNNVSVVNYNYPPVFNESNKKKSEENNSKNSNNNQSQSTSKNESGKRNPGSSLNQRFSGGGSVGRDTSVNACVVADPQEHTLIQVVPGQDIIIRLPIKQWEMKEDIGFFWAFNPIMLQQNHFFIKNQEMIRDGRKLFQEIVVSLRSKNVPQKVGKFILGGIQCSNQHETRWIVIQMAIDKVPFEDTNTEYSKCLRELVNSLRASRAAGQVKSSQVQADNGVVSTGQQAPRREVPVNHVVNGFSGIGTISFNNSDTLKVILKDKIDVVSVGSKENTVTQQWICSKIPKFLQLIDTIVCRSDKSFVFKVHKDITHPMSDVIQFICGNEVGNITVARVPSA